MIQPSLFDVHVPPPLPAHQRRSETSKAAAKKAASFAAGQRARLVAWFVEQGPRGGTQIEASAALGIKRQSMCPRIRELELDGQIRKTVDIRERARVYRAAATT